MSKSFTYGVDNHVGGAQIIDQAAKRYAYDAPGNFTTKGEVGVFANGAVTAQF